MTEDLWQNYHIDIFAIAADSLPELRATRDRNQLAIELCSDPDLDIARQYTGINRSDIHGESALPGTFVVDPDGIVQYAHRAEDTADRTYANQISTSSGVNSTTKGCMSSRKGTRNRTVSTPHSPCFVFLKNTCGACAKERTW
jgi:alkyl hydroperoxide reductase subunit AhpC